MENRSQLTAAIDAQHLESSNHRHAAAWHLPEDGLEESTRSLVLGVSDYVFNRLEQPGTTFLELVYLHQAVQLMARQVVTRHHGRLDADLIRSTLETAADMVAEAINGAKSVEPQSDGA